MLDEVRGNRASELPTEDAVDLDLHINACGDCRRLLAAEQKFDLPIRIAMRNVPLPINLKARILDQLATQRGAWYRKRIYVGAAVAACLVIAVGLLTWKPPRQAGLDLDEIALNADRYMHSPQEKIDRWLGERGLRYDPPVLLNPRLLAFHSMTENQGRQVPTLHYQTIDPMTNEPIFAQVYLIREGDFDLAALRQATEGSSTKGYHLEVHRDREHPDRLVYLILYKGDHRLEPFKVNFSST